MQRVTHQCIPTIPAPAWSALLILLFPLEYLPRIRAYPGKLEKEENGFSPHPKSGKLWEGTDILCVAAEIRRYKWGEHWTQGLPVSQPCGFFPAYSPACSFSPPPLVKTNLILGMNEDGVLTQTQGYHFQPGSNVVIWLWQPGFRLALRVRISVVATCLVLRPF